MCEDAHSSNCTLLFYFYSLTIPFSLHFVCFFSSDAPICSLQWMESVTLWSGHTNMRLFSSSLSFYLSLPHHTCSFYRCIHPSLLLCRQLYRCEAIAYSEELHSPHCDWWGECINWWLHQPLHCCHSIMEWILLSLSSSSTAHPLPSIHFPPLLSPSVASICWIKAAAEASISVLVDRTPSSLESYSVWNFGTEFTVSALWPSCCFREIKLRMYTRTKQVLCVIVYLHFNFRKIWSCK